MPGKPDKFVDMLLEGDGEKRSQRSFNRLDDSTLSHRLSHIPKDRAATMLSSSVEGADEIHKEMNGSRNDGNAGHLPAAMGNLI